MALDMLEVPHDFFERQPLEHLANPRLAHHQALPLRAHRRVRVTDTLPQGVGSDRSVPGEPRCAHDPRIPHDAVAEPCGMMMIIVRHAIHLATAHTLRQHLTAFVAYDRRLAEAAAALGMNVVSPS
jgi:hypothetical protein